MESIFPPQARQIPRIWQICPEWEEFLIPANAGLFHYAGNNPVRYIDPMGFSLDDWQDNGDGTWTVIAEGAKLWDVWGENWDILSGVSSEEDAKKIQIGQTYGFKRSTKSNTSPVFDIYKKQLLERAKTSTLDVPCPTQVKLLYRMEYTIQGIAGLSEMCLGVLGYVGVTYYGFKAEKAALKKKAQISPAVAYSMLTGYSLSGVLFADGFNLFIGAFQKKKVDPIFFDIFQNLITDPMVDLGNGLYNEFKKEKK